MNDEEKEKAISFGLEIAADQFEDVDCKEDIDEIILYGKDILKDSHHIFYSVEDYKKTPDEFFDLAFYSFKEFLEKQKEKLKDREDNSEE